MANATAFPELTGWQYLNDTSTFNPIKAAVVTLQSTPAGGLAWDFTSAGIVLLVPTLIYIRTQNAIASSFGMLLITMLMHYGGGGGSLLTPWVVKILYTISILAIAYALASYYLKKRGEP